MKTLTVDDLKEGPTVNHYYHASGTALIQPGEIISDATLEALKSAGISEVIELSAIDNIPEFVRGCKYDQQPVDSLVVGEKMSHAVYDEGGTLLLEAGSEVTESIPKTFKSRGFEHIFIKKDSAVLQMTQVSTYKEELKTAVAPAANNGEIASSQAEIPQDRMISGSTLDKKDLEKDSVENIRPSGEPFLDALVKHDKMRNRDQEEKDSFQGLQTQVMNKVRTVFGEFETGSQVMGNSVGMLSKNLLGGLVKDQDLLINLVHTQSTEASQWLVSHAMNVTILSVNIGTMMGYSEDQVLEVAYGALLHNVGMLKVSDKILNKKSRLTANERLEIQRHPVYGINYLQRVIGLPMSTPYVAYQSHERLNGTGYPKGRKGKLIHPFARIIMVADAFEAMMSDRPYRKGAIPYQAMEAVVRMTSRGLLDGDVVRSMLQFMSLFPIGSWVELSNGHLGKVVASNETNFTRPVVNILFEDRKPVEKPYRVDLSGESELKINRAFDGRPLESSVMDGF